VTREIDFGRGPEHAVGMPAGDLVTAYRSTEIPTITVYAAIPRPAAYALRALRGLGPVLDRPSVRRALGRFARTVVPGPSPEKRARGESLVGGRPRAETGASSRGCDPERLRSDRDDNTGPRRSRIRWRCPGGLSDVRNGLWTRFRARSGGSRARGRPSSGERRFGGP
jgi:hypothetical protein